MNATSRNIQVQGVILLFFIVTNFMSVGYLVHMVFREVFVWSCLSMIIIGRSKFEGENNIYAGFIISLSFCILFEAVLYSNHRAKAILFMRMEVSALQEEQLRSLLDTVPDKVLITSQANEDSAPKSIYSNK